MPAAMTSFERARERESAAKPALCTELVRWSDGDGTRACQVSQEWCAEGTTSGGGEGRSSEGAGIRDNALLGLEDYLAFVRMVEFNPAAHSVNARKALP